jgi:hypothetical protein
VSLHGRGSTTPSSLQGAPALGANDLVGWNGTGFVGVPNKSAFWLPENVIDESTPNRTGGSTTTITSGKLYLVGNMVIPAGISAGHVAFISGSQVAVEPTHWWFCIVDLAERKIRAVSADQLTAAWGTFTYKSLAMEAAYTPAADTAAYAGIMVAAATPPNLKSSVTTSGWTGGVEARKPITTGESNTGQTTPLTVGTVVTALTSVNETPLAAILA